MSEGKVYLVWSAGFDQPLTIYAGNTDDADLVYREWASIHEPSWSKHPWCIEEVSAEWLAERPQLAAEVDRAKQESGDWVFYFLGQTEGWQARPTFADRVGVIAPVAPLVRYYVVECDAEGADVELFALSGEDALQLYSDFHTTAYGKCDHLYTLSERSRWLLTGAKTVLRTEMDRGVVGVAGWDMKDGWHILDFDHPKAGD